MQTELVTSGGTHPEVFKLRDWYARFKGEIFAYKITFSILVLPLFLPFFHAVGNFILRFIPNSLLSYAIGSHFFKTLLFQILVEAALVAYVWLIAREGKYRPYFTLTHLLLGALGVVLVLTSLFSPDANASFFGSPRRGDGVFFLLHAGLYIFLLSWVVKEKIALEALFSLAVNAGLAMVGFVALRILSAAPTGIFGTGEWYRSFENILGNPNFVAHYLLLLLALSAYFCFQRRVARDLIAPSILLAAIVLTSSNTAIFLAGAIYLVLFWRFSRGFFYGAVILGLSGALYGAFAAGDSIFTRWISFVDSLSIRFYLWKDALPTVFRGRLFTGYGWGNNELFWNLAPVDTPAMFYDRVTHLFADRMHNIILESLSAAGLAGLALVIIIFANLIGSSLRAFKIRRQWQALFFAFVFVLQLIYLMMNFDTLMSYVAIALLIAGFIVFHKERAFTVPMRKILINAIFPVAAAGAVFLMYFYNGLTFKALLFKLRADVKIAQAKSYVNPPTEKIINELNDVLAIKQPYRSLWRDVATSFYNLSDAVELTPEENLRVKQSLISLYEVMLRYSPESINAYHNLALVETKFSEDFQSAAGYLEKAVNLAPASGILRLQLGLIYFHGKRSQQAEEIFLDLLKRGISKGRANLYLGFLDFQNRRMREGKNKIIIALSSYVPNGMEWDLLADYFLLSSGKEDLLVFYQRLIGLTRYPDRYLYGKIIMLARDIGRDDLAQKYRYEFLEKTR